MSEGGGGGVLCGPRVGSMVRQGRALQCANSNSNSNSNIANNNDNSDNTNNNTTSTNTSNSNSNRDDMGRTPARGHGKKKQVNTNNAIT